MKVGCQYLGGGVYEFFVWAPLRKDVSVHIVHPHDLLQPAGIADHPDR